jgi:protein-S-isoprenylcysteine O-methyltransferase Ste14
MKMIDIPPVWLVLCIWAAWLQSRHLPLDIGLGGAVGAYFGAALVVGGILLTILTLFEFSRAKTTPVPHRVPSALITTGPFTFTRNPIYLADLMILIGAILWLQAVISLILVPLFLLLIERRFITPEEERMREKFGEEFENYAGDVRRWL